MGKPDKSAWDFYNVKLTIFVSLLSWPMVYILDNGFETVPLENRTLVMTLGGLGLLLGVIFIVAKLSRVNDWMVYVMMLFSFTCMIDTIIALECLGLISGFMKQYLNFGEPYLFSPWGYAITIFDGVGFYILYLVTIHLISNGKSWKSIGIYWASGLAHSMIVLMLGIFSGKHTPTLCGYFNIPYILFPIFVLNRLLREKKTSLISQKGVISRFLDLLGAISTVIFISIVFAKGLICFGSEFHILLRFLEHDPAIMLNDPAPFAKIQNLVFLFYLIPIQVVYLINCFRNEKLNCLWEMALIQAGMVLQGQCSFILMSLDPNTPVKFQSNIHDIVFWGINLGVLLIPHLQLAILAYQHCDVSQNSRKKLK